MAADCVVVVDLLIDDDALADFMALLQANAQTSLQQEPGCHHFDVCVDQACPTRILLYEIYTDEAAFAAHLASAHYQGFDARTKQMIRSKSVRRLTIKAG